MSNDEKTMYSNLALELSQDADNDVVVSDSGLRVRGAQFAYLEERSLVVRLSAARATDLVTRGVASRVAPAGSRSDFGTWVKVTDSADWAELAAEAHQFVGEPAIGGES